MSMNLAPAPFPQFFDQSGNLLTGGLLFIYNDKTTTKAVSYTDSSGNTPNTNPIVLDSYGSCAVWLPAGQLYTFVLAPSTDTDPPTNIIKTVNDISAGGNVATMNFTPDTGVANALSIAVSGVVSLFKGLIVSVAIANPNTGATTLNLNATGPVPVVLQNGQPLSGGELNANGQYLFQYTGTAWQVLGFTVNPSSALLPQETSAGVTPVSYDFLFPHPSRYGVDLTGTTDSTTAFNNLLAVANQFLSVGIDLPGNANIRLDGGMSIDTNRVRLNGNGATLDFSHMTTGYAVTYINSETDPNQRVMRNISHPLSNMRWKGPGCSVTAVTAEIVSDTNAALYQIGGIKVDHVTYQDFATDSYLNNGANFITHTSCGFTQTFGATGTTYSIIMPATVTGPPATGQDSGERNAFIDCQWNNKALLILNQANVFGDIFCQNCSFDYFTNAINVPGGAGIVTCQGCHFEANTDLSQWGIVAAASSQIVLEGCNLSCTGNRTTWDLFWSDSTCTNGGITIRDCFVGTGANTFTTRLVGSTGAARVENVVLQYFGSRFALGASINTLAYGGFESGNYAAEWTLTAGANQSTTQAHNGSHSCQLPGTNAQNPNAVATVPCKPNQYAVGEFWFYSPLMTTGAFNGTLSYLDKGGNALLSLTVMGWTNANPPPNANTWTKRGFGTLSPAPPGTVSASIDFQITGTSTNLTGYIDDVILNVA